MSDKLIPCFEQVDLDGMKNIWLCMAKSTEASLQQTGDKPGKDYSIRDLYRLAQPFALEQFKNNDSITFNVDGW